MTSHTTFKKRTLLHSSWSSQELLAVLRSQQLALSDDRSEATRAELWRNLVAEYDAVHLSREIHRRIRSITPRFLNFEQLWLGDELNHYLGLRQIYSQLFDVSEHSLHLSVRERQPNFQAIEHFISDEFITCVCFAYDELASTRGYTDAFSLYDSFGNSSLSRFIRLTARDEMYHCLNAISLLQSEYRHRLLQVPSVLRQIVEAENSDPRAYQATFLFDHGMVEGSNPFTEHFLQDCANKVCKLLNIDPAFK